jgi:hypothetical protein
MSFGGFSNCRSCGRNSRLAQKGHKTGIMPIATVRQIVDNPSCNDDGNSDFWLWKMVESQLDYKLYRIR